MGLVLAYANCCAALVSFSVRGLGVIPTLFSLNSCIGISMCVCLVVSCWGIICGILSQCPRIPLTAVCCVVHVLQSKCSQHQNNVIITCVRRVFVVHLQCLCMLYV